MLDIIGRMLSKGEILNVLLRLKFTLIYIIVSTVLLIGGPKLIFLKIFLQSNVNGKTN